jgi:hypothetical protein
VLTDNFYSTVINTQDAHECHVSHMEGILFEYRSDCRLFCSVLIVSFLKGSVIGCVKIVQRSDRFCLAIECCLCTSVLFLIHE